MSEDARPAIHVVDGTYELFRAFYGAPARQSPSGMEVGATIAFGRSLLSMLEDPEVTHVACAFDTVIESFRNDLFDGYKTGEGIDPLLGAQFPLVERMTEALGAVAWRMVEFEADDALATAADRFFADERVRQVVICSPDKDLMQCIRGDRVVTWDRMRRKIYDEAAAIEKMGVPPTSIPDYLALVGDTADGIPGLPRWGARSTAAVLQKYRHLEFIPADENEWEVAVRGAKTLAAGLTEHLEAARLFRTLATLRTDVPLEEGFAELEWKGANRPLLETLAMELGDTSLVERVSRFAP